MTLNFLAPKSLKMNVVNKTKVLEFNPITFCPVYLRRKKKSIISFTENKENSVLLIVCLKKIFFSIGGNVGLELGPGSLLCSADLFIFPPIPPSPGYYGYTVSLEIG